MFRSASNITYHPLHAPRFVDLFCLLLYGTCTFHRALCVRLWCAVCVFVRLWWLCCWCVLCVACASVVALLLVRCLCVCASVVALLLVRVVCCLCVCGGFAAGACCVLLVRLWWLCCWCVLCVACASVVALLLVHVVCCLCVCGGFGAGACCALLVRLWWLCCWCVLCFVCASVVALLLVRQPNWKNVEHPTFWSALCLCRCCCCCCCLTYNLLLSSWNALHLTAAMQYLRGRGARVSVVAMLLAAAVTHYVLKDAPPPHASQDGRHRSSWAAYFKVLSVCVFLC